MDKKIKKILSDKIDESLNEKTNIEKIVRNFKNNNSDSLYTGILIGRLYNSFYYQHRRILKRNPSNEEFNEFVDFIKSHVSELYSN